MNVGFASLLPGAVAGAGDAPAPRSAGGLEHSGPAGAEGGAGTAFASLLLTLLGVNEGDAPSGNGQGGGSGPDAEGEAASDHPEGPATSREAPAARGDTQPAVAMLPAAQATRAGWATLAQVARPASPGRVDGPDLQAVWSESRPVRREEAAPAPDVRVEAQPALHAQSAPDGAHAPAPRIPAAPVGSPSLDTVAGVERAMEVREAFSANPVQHMTLRMEGGDGAVQRVRVELADRVPRSQVEVADPRLASRDPEPTSTATPSAPNSAEAPVDAVAPVEGGPPVHPVAAPTAPVPPVAADVRVADRSLARLHPELKARVGRVMERMQKEHGLAVTLVEGYRTRERQDFLFAQGRTAPGPVVTWTRDSNHNRGLAADLKVEGPWRQTEAYAHLQRIAREEGLGTLGMKDPGHVELKGQGHTPWSPPAVGGRGELPGRPERSPWHAAQPREVHGAAPVAAVARTAQVARPARPGRVDGPDLQAAWSESRPLRREAAASAPDGRADDQLALHAQSALDGAHAPAPRTPTAPVGSPALDTVAGVERALEVREAFSANPVQRVTLRMEGGDGAVQRVRVDLVDRVLRSQVEVADPRLASRLQADGPSLLRALEARGYEAPEVTVAGVAAASTRGDAGPDLLASLARGDALPQALRALFGEAPAAGGGRGTQDQGTRQHPDRGHGQDGFQQHSRRENRREGR